MKLLDVLSDKSLPSVKFLHRKALSPNECMLVAGERLYSVSCDGIIPMEVTVHDLIADDWELKYFFDTRNESEFRYP